MRYLSLCSGIEAASVAWKPLGWTPLAFAEIEKFPSAVVAHHYPGVPNLGDITRFKEWPDLGPVDVICGGTPCQSFSVAGLRKGLADPRGNLSLTFLAIVDRYRPRYVVWENVPGVLSSDGGRDFAAFLGGLGQLGYGWCFRVLDAQYARVDGFPRAVPQRRRRVFVVGCLGDWRRAAAVLSEPESVLGNTPPRREAGERIAGRAALSVAGSLACNTGPNGHDAGNFACNQAVDAGHLIASTGETRGQDPVVAVAPTLRAGGNETGGDRPYGTDVDTCDSLVVAHSLRAEGFDANEDGTGRGTPLVPVSYIGPDVYPTLSAHEGGTLTQIPPICFSAKDHGADALENLSPTLRAGGHSESHANAGVMPAIAFAQNQREEVRLMDVAGALAAEPGMKQQTYVAFNGRMDPVHGDVPGALDTDPMTQCVAFQERGRENGRSLEIGGDVAFALTAPAGGGRAQERNVLAGWAVRRLTPTECERLMGFPDGYTAITFNGKPAADGPKYKALGNSWAVNVARWIGLRIEMVEALAGEQIAEAAE